MQNTKREITMHYFENLMEAIGNQKAVDIPNAKVKLYKGRASAINIEHDNRTIDLSQGPDGEMLEGFELVTKDAPHDDERDVIIEKRPFPENEGDIAFLEGIAEAIRSQREN